MHSSKLAEGALDKRRIHRICIGPVPGIGLLFLALKTGREPDELAQRFLCLAIEEAALADPVIERACLPLVRQALAERGSEKHSNEEGARANLSCTAGGVRLPDRLHGHRLEN